MAQVYLARLLKTATESKAQFRGHPANQLLGTLGGILEGEIHRSDGDLNGAIASLPSAPPRFTTRSSSMTSRSRSLAARHWLGAALLEAKRYDDAERVYREELGRSIRTTDGRS